MRTKYLLTNLSHLDPFYIKQEFAPSEKSFLLKRQQAAHDLIAPHLRILQFLASHLNATRLSSPHLQRTFHRLINPTLQGLQDCAGHPLAREIHFHILLLALTIIRYCTGLNDIARWKLKNAILSSGLQWFSHQPRWVPSRLEGFYTRKIMPLTSNRWSFGGNRLQLKAETRLMADVNTALLAISHIGSKAEGNFHSLVAKQELLHTLLVNEQDRLSVWLHPLDQERRHVFSAPLSGRLPPEASPAGSLSSSHNANMI